MLMKGWNGEIEGLRICMSFIDSEPSFREISSDEFQPFDFHHCHMPRRIGDYQQGRVSMLRCNIRKSASAAIVA